MACNLVLPISGTECIGDSRVKINNNFESLCTAINALSAETVVRAPGGTTSTINSYVVGSGRVLFSDVRNNSLSTVHISNEAITTDKIALEAVRYSQLASWQTLSASPTLSAEAVQPRLAKAWVNFDGTGTPSIKQSFNVSSLIDNGTGSFTIMFRTPMSSLGYCAVGTANGVAFTSFPVALETSLLTDRVTIASSSLSPPNPASAYDSPEYKLVVFAY
jgi:hypothetical protein